MKSMKMFDKMIDMAVKYPELTPDRVLVINMREKTIEKIITHSRLELIRIIRTKEPGSVGKLAKMLKRPVESVSRDLKILESYGILELIQVGKVKKPRIEKDMIMIPISV